MPQECREIQSTAAVCYSHTYSYIHTCRGEDYTLVHHCVYFFPDFTVSRSTAERVTTVPCILIASSFLQKAIALYQKGSGETLYSVSSYDSSTIGLNLPASEVQDTAVVQILRTVVRIHYWLQYSQRTSIR